MKVQIPQPLDPQVIMQQLGPMLPGYKFSMRGGKVLVCEKTAAVGATVFFRKKVLVVNGNFPNMGLQLVFVLSVVFLGILIPLLIFFLTVYKSQKASEQEVGAIAGAVALVLLFGLIILFGDKIGDQAYEAPAESADPQQR